MGRVIHLTPSKKVVVKAENLPKIGERIFDEKHNLVGVVFDVFGPVSSPYVEVEPEVEDPRGLVGIYLYALSQRNKRNKTKNRERRSR